MAQTADPFLIVGLSIMMNEVCRIALLNDKRDKMSSVSSLKGR